MANKKIQITRCLRTESLKVIVRKNDTRKDYKNLTRASMNRLQKLAYNANFRLTTVLSFSGPDLFFNYIGK